MGRLGYNTGVFVMIKNLEKKSYWFFNTALPTHLPKKVTCINIRGRVARFDSYIQNEKFAQVDAVRESLFNTESEALRQFVLIISGPRKHFVEDSAIKKLKEDLPEYWL